MKELKAIFRFLYIAALTSGWWAIGLFDRGWEDDRSRAIRIITMTLTLGLVAHAIAYVGLHWDDDKET